MKTFMTIAGVLVVPLIISIIASLIARWLDCDEATVKYYAGFYLGLSYTVYMYEVGFIKSSFKL